MDVRPSVGRGAGFRAGRRNTVDSGCPVVIALLLAAVLLGLGIGTAVRQRRTLRRLRQERFLPSDERAYLRGQVFRRLLTSVVLVVLGGMIGGAFLSGMEARATEIAERQRKAEGQPADDPGRPADAQPPNEDDRRFVKVWGYYWIAVLLVVFVAVCLATVDFWATRRYWMAQYKLIKADHEAKLQRDLAVYRQAKLNDRMKGKRPGPPDDTDPEGPPRE